MKKEEILQKSRQTHEDEGMEYAENQGRKIGVIIFVLVAAFLSVFTLFFGESSTLYAIFSLFWVVFAAGAYGKYCFTKRKVLLIIVVAGSIASICYIASYVLTTLR